MPAPRPLLDENFQFGDGANRSRGCHRGKSEFHASSRDRAREHHSFERHFVCYLPYQKIPHSESAVVGPPGYAVVQRGTLFGAVMVRVGLRYG